MQNHHLKNMLALGMAAILFALSITGCKKTGTEVETETIPQAETPTYLTNIYSGTEITPPGENIYLGDVVSVDADNIVFHATRREVHGEWGDEDYSMQEITCFYTVPTTGGAGELTELGNITAGDSHVQNIRRMPDGGMLALISQYDEQSDTQTAVLRLFRDGQVAAQSEELSTLFPEGRNRWFYTNLFLVDKDGYVYLTYENNLLILTPELTVAGSITADDYLNVSAMDGDGVIYFQCWGGDGMVLLPVDRDAKKFGTPIALPQEQARNMTGLFFGEGKTLYGYDDKGIYTMQPGSDEARELVMSFTNSNLAGSTNSVCYVPGGKFLLTIYDTLVHEQTTAIYEKAPDLDLSSVSVLQVCYCRTGNDELLPMLTVRYNKAHPDKRVVLTQYEDEEKLGQEIRTGTYTPDVIIASMANATYRSLIKDDYFIDFMPFVEADDTISRENLFGCIFNSYTKDGRLSGIPRGFSIRTVLGNKSIVGDRNGWTVHDFITFIKELPDGVTFRRDITKQNYWDLFGGQTELLSAFIDWDQKTCSFDSADFIDLLAYIASLPQEFAREEEREISESNPYGTYTDYRNGKIAATAESARYRGAATFILGYAYFGRDNMVYCGYPTADGKNGTLLNSTTRLCTILKFCENTDMAWEFLKEYLCFTYAEIDRERELPVLHSRFRKMQTEKMYYYLRYDGGMSGSNSPQELDENGLYHGTPSEAYSTDDIDFDAIERWLDGAGAPALQFAYPEELSNLISEEISAYLGGARSAEETAKMLQSRVSIYLAEQN